MKKLYICRALVSTEYRVVTMVTNVVESDIDRAKKAFMKDIQDVGWTLASGQIVVDEVSFENYEIVIKELNK